MKKIIYILITLVFFFTSCEKESENIYSVDSLVISLKGNNDDSQLMDVGDGNWAVKLAAIFEGEMDISISTKQAWTASIEEISQGEVDWLKLSTEEGVGTSTIQISIEENLIPEFRKASIIITTLGEIPVKRKITVEQKNIGVLNVSWKSNFLLSEGLMVFGPNERVGEQIATFNAESDEVVISVDVDWISVELENDKVLIYLDNLDNGDNVREANLTLTNMNGGLTKQMRLKQYDQEVFSEKSFWSIEAGNDKTTATNNDPFSNIIDGDIDTHWQWGWNIDGGAGSDFPKTPYDFIIDLGESQIFNTFMVWQTQKATNGYIKDIQFKVSNDKSEWIDLGVFRMASTAEEAKNNQPNPDVFTLPITCEMQYVRLIVLSNVGGSSVNNAKNAYLGEFNLKLK